MLIAKKLRYFLIFLLLLLLPLFLLKSKKASTTVDSSSDFALIPIIMYHSVSKNKAIQGKYVISVEEFKQDITTLKEKGFTTILMSDLLDYVFDNKPLPDKPIILTFDDGYYNNYLYAYPLLKENNCKAIISPIGKYTDQYTNEPNTNPDYAHITWGALKEMQNSGLVEIQNHTYNMHSTNGKRKGCKRCYNEPLDKYKTTLINDIGLMQNKIYDNLNTQATTFVYPFGAISECCPDILKSMGFKATFDCENKINAVTHDPSSLFNLHRFIRPHGISSEKFFRTKIKI